jgi:2-C-methyl-D-erythritol 2,4-cyclodiphosphate synthase
VIRTGIGFDAHRFDETRRLVLGGIEIASSPGLAGHSDADVLSHAIADALLGAARLGDLGTMFPNDERWRDAPSSAILEATAGALRKEGWTICNIDATVIAEEPRLAPHRESMIDQVALALGIEAACVWIKATTTDGLGFTGRAEGIAALATALVERR